MFRENRSHERREVAGGTAGARKRAPRRARQQEAVAGAAASMRRAFTVEDLAKRVAARGDTVGLATVYRAVAALLGNGLLQCAGSEQGKTLYVACSSEVHHHHAVCTSCGSVSEAECPVDASVAGALAAEGFTVTGHEVTLYGLCARCAGREEG